MCLPLRGHASQARGAEFLALTGGQRGVNARYECLERSANERSRVTSRRCPPKTAAHSGRRGSRDFSKDESGAETWPGGLSAMQFRKTRTPPVEIRIETFRRPCPDEKRKADGISRHARVEAKAHRARLCEADPMARGHP